MSARFPSIGEAPLDGTEYGRQSGKWVAVAAAGGAVPEAPSDGNIYGRQNAGWTQVPPISNPVFLGTTVTAPRVTIIPAAGVNASLILNKPASGVADFISAQTNSTNRWLMALGDNVAESGGNAGSNFYLARYDDSGGTQLDKPITISRSTGALTLGQLGPAAIKGVTDGSDAVAGYVGEFVSAAVTTAVSLTTGVAHDLTTLTLSAGDWDVVGEAYFQGSSSSGSDDLRVWVNTVATTQPTGDQGGLAIGSTSSGGLINNYTCSPLRVLSATSTLLYLGVNATFGSGTMVAKGFIRARRMR
jgi:hypothetical protein